MKDKWYFFWIGLIVGMLLFIPAWLLILHGYADQEVFAKSSTASVLITSIICGTLIVLVTFGIQVWQQFETGNEEKQLNYSGDLEKEVEKLNKIVENAKLEISQISDQQVRSVAKELNDKTLSTNRENLDRLLKLAEKHEIKKEYDQKSGQLVSETSRMPDLVWKEIKVRIDANGYNEVSTPPAIADGKSSQNKPGNPIATKNKQN